MMGMRELTDEFCKRELLAILRKNWEIQARLGLENFEMAEYYVLTIHPTLWEGFKRLTYTDPFPSGEKPFDFWGLKTEITDDVEGWMLVPICAER
jgi:hypothetical protein